MSNDALAQVWVESGLNLLSWTDRTDPDDPVLRTAAERLAAAPITPGAYWIRLTQTAGETILGSFADGTWIDAAEDPLWYITTGTKGEVLLAEATLEFTIDDGAGSPDLAEVVLKPVSFRAEFLGASGVLIGTGPWSLEHVAVEEDAFCTIRADTDGFLYGIEGGFTAHKERYGNSITPDWTVQFDKVSGDDPTSGVLGSPLSLRNSQEVKWLTNTVPFTPAAVVNVTISDGSESVTKQVTVRAEYQTDIGSDIVLDPTEVEVTDEQDAEASLTLFVNSNGNIDIVRSDGSQPLGFPQSWHSDFPNPTDSQSYEVFLEEAEETNGRETSPPTVQSDATGVWRNLSTNRDWTLFQQDGPFGVALTKWAKWTITIRRIGVASSAVSKTINLQVTSRDLTGIDPELPPE